MYGSGCRASIRPITIATTVDDVDTRAWLYGAGSRTDLGSLVAFPTPPQGPCRTPGTAPASRGGRSRRRGRGRNGRAVPVAR